MWGLLVGFVFNLNILVIHSVSRGIDTRSFKLIGHYYTIFLCFCCTIIKVKFIFYLRNKPCFRILRA